MTAISNMLSPIGDFSVHLCHDLKPQHRYMLAFLIDNAAQWADQDGWVKFGRRSLGERLGLDHAMVRRLIAALQDAGYLAVETGGGAQKYSRYKLSLPRQTAKTGQDRQTGQGVNSDPVYESAPVQKHSPSEMKRCNIVPLKPAQPPGKPGFHHKQHRVPIDSHRFESELPKEDSIRMDNEIVEKLTDLFQTERAKAHPFAKPVREEKTRRAVEQCLEEGVKPESLAANMAGGMTRGRFKDDPPSSPLAFKRSAAEEWNGPNFRNPVVKLQEPVAVPGLTEIAAMPVEIRDRLFARVQQSLRLRSPQKAAALDVGNVAGWAGFVRADFL